LVGPSRRAETQVAEAVVQKVHAAAQARSPAREQDAGYYLISDGLTQVEHATGYRFGFWEGLWRASTRMSLPLYIGTIAMLSLFLLLGFLDAIDAEGRDLIAPIILGFLPATEIAIAITNRILTRRLGPACLAGLKLADAGKCSEAVDKLARAGSRCVPRYRCYPPARSIAGPQRRCRSRRSTTAERGDTKPCGLSALSAIAVGDRAALSRRSDPLTLDALPTNHYGESKRMGTHDTVKSTRLPVACRQCAIVMASVGDRFAV
jgi:hypothetical protein